MRCLVVDDESLARQRLTTLLNDMCECQVCGEAANGEQALQQVQQLRPDLVLMDVRLQGRMSGVDAAREIHRRFGIPIVFVTANEGEELDVPDLPSPGARIPKPFTDEQLERTLRQTLRGAKT